MTTYNPIAQAKYRTSEKGKRAVRRAQKAYNERARQNLAFIQQGNRLRSLRKELGYSAPRLGQQIGRSEYQIYKWENGLGKPSPESIERLAPALGMTPSQLTRWYKKENDS